VGEFTLYRGQQRGCRFSILAVTLTAEQPSPATPPTRTQYSLAADLDPEWAARPLEATRHEGRTMLVLKTQEVSPWIVSLIGACASDSTDALPACRHRLGDSTQPSSSNIRELQNVIERSLIVSSGDIFSVDESWLSKESLQPPSQGQVSRPMEGESHAEREIIEAALAESRGRVAGALGGGGQAPNSAIHS
jgi:hypothetical protein